MTQLSDTMNIAFGEVVNVKTIPSRGVTRIEIEIPSEYHVAATELLFGKPAFIFPVASKPAALPSGARYGIVPFAKGMSMAQRSATPAEANPTGTAMFGGSRGGSTYVAQAGQVCREDTSVWRVLSERTGMPVTNESQATLALRTALGISSRAELADNSGAQALFRDLLSEAHAVPA